MDMWGIVLIAELETEVDMVEDSLVKNEELNTRGEENLMENVVDRL